MAFRDGSVVIIETGRSYIRAGVGLHELLRTPSVDIPARAGLRRSAANGHANGAASGYATPYPGGSRAVSAAPPRPPIAADYLVGKQLDEQLAAGDDIEVVWPFAHGFVSDWTAAEAIWKYVLFTELGIRRTQNESPVLHAVCSTLSRDIHERMAKVFFERFNVAAYSVIERPLAQLYATSALTGLVIDIDRTVTDIIPAHDCLLLHMARVAIRVGAADCFAYLAHLLRGNAGVVAALEDEPDGLDAALLDLAKYVCAQGHVKVPGDGETAEPEDEGVTNIAAVLVAGKEKAVIEAGTKKKAAASRAAASAAEREREREIAALDLITFDFREKSVTLGRERHRLCEPLFDPSLLQGVPGVEDKTAESLDLKLRDYSLQQGVNLALKTFDIQMRQLILDGVYIGGALSAVKGLGAALQARMAPFLAKDPENDSQPKYIRLIKVPEYFAEYRDKWDLLSAFLGASIVAKLVFNDPNSKNYVSKADYSTRGPRSIIELCPTVL